MHRVSISRKYISPGTFCLLLHFIFTFFFFLNIYCIKNKEIINLFMFMYRVSGCVASTYGKKETKKKYNKQQPVAIHE